MKSENDLCKRYINIFFVVAIYWIVSMTTVFVNKTLLSSQSGGLSAPLFITWFQCVVSFLICWTFSTTKGIPGMYKFPEGTPWHIDTMKKVIPLSIMFTGMVAANNICLQYVGVAFYYISRSLTTVFNVALGTILLGQSTSKQCIACCGFIVLGFWLGVDQERVIDSFSLYGTIFGVLGSLMLSLYSIYTKRILPHVNQEVILLSYYNNAYSMILFLPLILISGELHEVLHFKNIHNYVFWIQMIGGGVCGFAIGYVTSLQIKVTSPLTHNISGTAKACAQTVIATHWYNDSKTFLWWLSNFVVVGASALYARFKQLEMEKAAQINVDKEEKANLV
ncbi:GDP-fucose transporter nac isoform X1 [Arctopsyche grandis]|uniref:GDP-fucose transporter nac isoform X1 n=1 Tax=Arctopsyche grandis TaxID=121162 RepID=UPI00406D91C6